MKVTANNRTSHSGANLLDPEPGFYPGRTKAATNAHLKLAFADGAKRCSSATLSLLTCFFVVALCCVHVQAQAVSGDLTGVIQDASGALIPGVTVIAKNEATGTRATVTSSETGSYRFTNLSVGSYTLTAFASGFAPSGVKGVRVELNNTLTSNIMLQVANITTTIEVSDAGAAMDTTTAQVQTTFGAQAAQDIATAAKGTGIYNLSLLGAGVSSSGGVGQGTGPSVAGQRPENNTFSLDGVSNDNHYTTGPLVSVPNDAIDQLSLLQNQFSPEFGGGSGGIFNAVVKSGTNQFHGSAYEYLQNRNLNAVDSTIWNQGLTANPRYDNNRLGATIGGPILKDKLFYFGNFEYNPIGQSAVPGQVLYAPTATGYSVLGSVAGISKTNLGVLQRYLPAAPVADQGTISVGTASIPIGSLSSAAPTYSNSYSAVVASDYNLNEKDQLRGRWIYNKIKGLDTAAALPVFFTTAPYTNQLVSLTEFHSFSPNLQNEFRVSFSRAFNQISAGSAVFPGLSAFPNITVDDLQLQLGPNPNTPTGFIQNLFQLQDSLTKVWGKHTIKAGFHFTDIIMANYFIQRVRGDYEYSSLEQFLMDRSPDGFGERSAAPGSYPAGFLQNAAFLNDDFRLRPNLTLNLGLRYEYVTVPVASRYQSYSAPASIPGGITFAEPKPGLNDWAPRLGIAWSPGSTGKWSLRAGFSRSFDLTYGNLISGSAPPYFQTTQDVDLSANSSGFLAGGGLAGVSPALPTDPVSARGIISSYTFGGQRPYGLTWTGSVQRLLGKDYTFEARYTGTKGIHLWNQTRLNIASKVTSSLYIPTFFSTPSAATFAGMATTLGQIQAQPNNLLASYGFSNPILAYAPQGYSSYNGLALQLNKRYSNNLSYIAAYTWSHLLDDATATNFSTHLSPRRAQDFQNLRSEWASSALDRRHRLTFTPMYDWKAFQSTNRWMKNVLSNWNVSGTYTYQSPEFATVQSNVDSNLNNDTAGDRAIINTAGAFNSGSGVTAYNAKGQVVASGNASTVAYVANNPSARFVVAGPGAFANSGRNNFPLKPTNNIDAALMKRFTLAENRRIEFGAQFFNVLNHAQYVGGYLNDVAPNGYINSRSELIPNNALFGRFDQFYSSNSRNIQLLARFVF